MSNLEQRISAAAGGNIASTAELKKLLGPADIGSGHAGKAEPAPGLKVKPDLN